MKIKEESKDKVEIVEQTQVESQRLFVTRIRPQRGHTLFEFNPIDKTVQKATFKVEKVISFENATKGAISQNKEVDGKVGCVYISALNEKNAWKKFNKYLEQQI